MVSPFLKLGDAMGGIGDGMKEMATDINTFLDYFDVTGPKFFMKIAFIPKDGALTAFVTDLKTQLSNKFPVFEQMIDTFESVSNQVSADKKTWNGIKVNLNKFGVGSLTVIDPTFVNEATPKLKFWIGGLMYFFTIMYCVRKISTLIGVGR